MSTPAHRVRSSATPNYGNAFSIDENQSFFGQQTTQVWYDAAIPAIGDVLVDGRAHLLWQLREQVGCVVSAQFLNIFRAIGIHWIRAHFFRGGNVRAGNDDTFHFRRGTGADLREAVKLASQNHILSENIPGKQQGESNGHSPLPHRLSDQTSFSL